MGEVVPIHGADYLHGAEMSSLMTNEPDPQDLVADQIVLAVMAQDRAVIAELCDLLERVRTDPHAMVQAVQPDPHRRSGDLSLVPH